MPHGERKTQIIEAAAQLFSERGYHTTSVRDIAAALDLQGGSLYAHIQSKEELLWLIVERAAEQFFNAIRPLAVSDIPPDEKLRRAVHAHIRVITDDLAAATVYFHEWRFLDEDHRNTFLEQRREYENLWRRMIREAMEAGVLRNDEDPKYMAILLLSAMNWLYHWYRPGGPLSPEEIAERFWRMLLEGLRSPVFQVSTS
nr:TetR/AcrR family transcriptional regulator [Ardenticatena sp.]